MSKYSPRFDGKSLGFPHPRMSQDQSPLLPADHAPGPTPVGASGHLATVVLDPEDHGEVGSAIPQSSMASRRPPAGPNHEQLISSFSALGDKFFSLQGIQLQSYKGLLSSYEEASESSSRAGQLENELMTLRKKKAQEEGTLQRRLRKLSGVHNTAQEKYAASFHRTEAVKAKLEGMQAKRDSALLERYASKKDKDALKKERESLRAGRDEMLEANDRLLGYLTESQRQAQIMKASLEGVITSNGLSNLVHGFDARRDLLLQLFSFALERTIQVVQARMDE
ncbi:hypothetical protein LIER_38169 [Lithospermum erythrorhizon]|uniref:Uncharacterized protein n=1 Tax=Lithospermum erythrorhizon TaxID=34254 RepID=A0AAV3PX87_LITER